MIRERFGRGNHELRGRTMPAYHIKPAADGAAGAAGH
jgi:hypothetical protein